MAQHFELAELRESGDIVTQESRRKRLFTASLLGENLFNPMGALPPSQTTRGVLEDSA